jgi:uncharacterized damage-inducible protein DinB
MKRGMLLTLGLVICASHAALAQDRAAAPTGVRGDLLAQLDDAASKLEQLGQAIPQDKYSWRPGSGVRSVGEVLEHVTGGNYFLLSFAGVKAPSNLPKLDSTATSAQVLEQLRRSFDHVRGAIRGMTDADLAKPATMFGRQTTYRGVLLTTVTHAHEHLGQLIAYARSSGVVPPWSREGSN